MPFDSLPEVTTRDPFTLEALRDWLRTKDPAEKYCWHGDCLFRRYGQFVSGGRLGGAAAYTLAMTGFAKLRHPAGGECGIAIPPPWNMGAALTRCEAAIAARDAEREGRHLPLSRKESFSHAVR